MIRLSCAIMAHPARADLVCELLGRLDRPAHVVWDRHSSEWDTGSRAWEAADPAATHHLVLQDDVMICRDLVAGLEQALAAVPREAVVSLYFGDGRPRRRRMDELTEHASRFGSPWLVMPGLIWGPAILAPTSSIAGMLTWCRNGHPNYDTRIGAYYEHILGWPAWYTWPSLVDHRAEPSLLGHPGGRHARWFIGQSASALDVPWSDAANLPTSTPLRGKLMTDLVQAKTAAVMRGAFNGRIAKGQVYCADDPVVKSHPNLFQPLDITHHCKRPPVEQMTAAPGEVREVAVYHCDHPGCSATAKSPAGLAAHKRSHSGDGE